MAVKVIRAKRQKKKETIIFSIICVLIVLLIGLNIWAICNLVEKNKLKGSPSLISENKSIAGYVLKANEQTNETLKFNSDILNPGDSITNRIRICNRSNDELYLRLSVIFEISIDSVNYEEKDFAELVILDNYNWKQGDDQKYYSMFKVSGHDYIDVNTQIKIKDDLEQSDIFDEYKDKLYTVKIMIETLNAENVISTETQQDIIDSWII